MHDLNISITYGGGICAVIPLNDLTDLD